MEIPFYRSRGFRCGQAAVRMVSGVVRPNERYSWKTLDNLTGGHGDKFTYSSQIAAALIRLGIDIDYFADRSVLEQVVNSDIASDIKRVTKEHASQILPLTDIDAIKESIRVVLESDCVRELKPDMKYIEKEFREGNLVICTLDLSRIFNYGPNERYKGHFVVITDIKTESVVFHDCGPKTAMPNREVGKNTFISAWDMCYFDYDTIVVKK